MKTSHIVGILIIICAVAAALFFALRGGGESESAVTAGDAQPFSVLVTPIREQVTARKGGVAEGVVLTEAEQLEAADSLSTNDKGRALIEGGDLRFVLDFLTEISVASLQSSHESKVKLSAGYIWGKLEKALGREEFVEVETANALAAVRGTSFGVGYVDTTTELIVTRGVVSFTARDPETGELIPGTEVLVEAGKKAYRTGNGDIVIEPITEADRTDEWYIYNNEWQATTTPEAKPEPKPVSTGQTTPPSVTPTPTTPVQEPPQTPVITETPTQPRKPIRIIEASPAEVDTDFRGTVTVTGSGFDQVTHATLSNEDIKFTIVSDSKVTFKMIELPPGEHSLRLRNSDSSESDILRSAISVYEPELESPNYPTTYVP